MLQFADRRGNVSPLADASDADAHIRDKAHGHKELTPPLGHAPTQGGRVDMAAPPKLETLHESLGMLWSRGIHFFKRRKTLWKEKQQFSFIEQQF